MIFAKCGAAILVAPVHLADPRVCILLDERIDVMPKFGVHRRRNRIVECPPSGINRLGAGPRRCAAAFEPHWRDSLDELRAVLRNRPVRDLREVRGDH